MLASFQAGADPAAAGEEGASAGGGDDLAKKLQNPVADLISVPIQFNYDEGFGPRDAGRWTLNVQPVIPIRLNDDWNLISRTIVPLIHQESIAAGVSSDTGLGDIAQSLFFSPREPINGWIIGFGPVALLPTATEEALGSEQFGLGPTAVILRQQHGWTYGALANHIWGLTDGDEHADVNATFLQPFVSYTFPTSTSVTLNSEMTYDWTAEEWTIPVNLMVSQLVVFGGQPVQFSLGGRGYADSPPGGPEWGVRLVVTLLFPK
ncbi:MAG: hypothetical protein KDA21_11960 [Phycisphaerales bacterium]|nr:hypothetical protein [Phycisphaerales bacterium]